MKKAWMVALVLGVASTVAMAQTDVMSVNVVGFTKVNVLPGGKFNLFSTPFDSIDQADANLLGVFGTNSLTKLPPFSLPPPFADVVSLFDPSVPEWKFYYQGTDNMFYDVDAWPAGSPTNPPLAPGEGFLLQSSVGSTTTNTIALMGEVVSVATQTLAMVTGFQVCGYPFSSDIDIQNTSFASMPGATKLADPMLPPPLADVISVMDASGNYVNYYLNTDGKWYDVSAWPAGTPVTDVVLRLGQGFWYNAIGSFSWVETNKYINNL